MSYKKYDLSELAERLLFADWDLYYRLPSSCLNWNFIIDIIIDYLDELCPFGNIVFKDFGNDWFNNEILELVNLRKENLIHYKITGDNKYFEMAKNLRLQISEAIMNSKSSMFKEKLNELKGK